MITASPRSAALLAYSAIIDGVRWADTTRRSCGTPNSSRTSAAFCIVSQSDLLPMITPTRGFDIGCSLLVVSPWWWVDQPPTTTKDISRVESADESCGPCPGTCTGDDSGGLG